MMSNVDMYLREKKIMYATFKTLGNRRTDTDYVVLFFGFTGFLYIFSYNRIHYTD